MHTLQQCQCQFFSMSIALAKNFPPSSMLTCLLLDTGGQEEYEAVIRFVQELPSAKYICSQQRLVNRPTAPILLLIAVKE